MVEMLVDRRLCDGLGGKDNDKALYRKCDEAMFRLLVVELVAVNLGLLVAVIHFILLVARCCTFGQRERTASVRERIDEEQAVLLVLMERRRRLIEETEALEARRGRELPPIPVEEDASGDVVDHEEAEEEDLIDMVSDQRPVTNETPDTAPAALDTDSDIVETRFQEESLQHS